MSDQIFSPEELVSVLQSDSKSLGLPSGSTEPIIERVLHAVLVWLEERNIITKSDLERVVSSELDKYSPDLALVYRNRNKVI
ncbi:hypothetical protein IK146_01410 [Candidatus Saccharibacteria bacterium]|nr:hypothetical protein [Candidatus Saccharibacteria bacterium]